MKTIFLGLFSITAGVILSILLYDVPVNNHSYSFNADDLKSLDTGFLFLDIFLNNLLVGIVLAILGYFSGGLLSLVVLFWNGYLLGMIYKMGLETLPIIEVLFYSKHLLFEIPALILFANFGLKGFDFFQKIVVDKEINIIPLSEFKKLIVPVILICFGSILEVI